MKLIEWLRGVGLARHSHIDDEVLHVIGTCGGCKHYSRTETSSYGYCDIQENPQNRIVIKPEYGCIHFEPTGK